MEKPFKVALMHNGTNYGKIHRQCMDILLKATEKKHTTIQLEYVDCKRIRELESFISRWLRFEENCIKQSGPYASKVIPDMMRDAEKLLGIGVEVIFDEEIKK